MNISAKPFILFVVFVALHSCGLNPSAVKVGNGLSALDNEFNNPVQIIKTISQQGEGFCNIGFVNDTTAFSALHCVQKNGQIVPDNISITTPSGQDLRALNVFAHPTGRKNFSDFNTIASPAYTNLYKEYYQRDKTCSTEPADLMQRIEAAGVAYEKAYDAYSKHDFAVLVFPKGTGQSFVGNGEYFGLSNKTVQNGQVTGVAFVGYGHNANQQWVMDEGTCLERSINTGIGTRRFGYNDNIELKGERLYAAGTLGNPQGGAITLGGDSGSVWLACYGEDCKSMDAVGITSGGRFGKDNAGDSVGPSLHSNISKATMKLAVDCQNPTAQRPCAEKFRGYDEVVLGLKSQTTTPEVTPPINPPVTPPTQGSGALNNLALKVVANGAGGYTADFILPSSVNQTDIKVCKADKVAGCTTVQFSLSKVSISSTTVKQYRISGVALNESVVIVAGAAHSRGFKLTK